MTNRRELLQLSSIGSVALPLTKSIQAELAALTAAVHDLRAEMQGSVVLPGEEAYASVRQIWDGAVTYRPAVFALCERVTDVQAAVGVARAHNLQLSVRGGGHDWAGRALRDGGLVIDLTHMRQVQVDPVAKSRDRETTLGPGSQLEIVLDNQPSALTGTVTDGDKAAVQPHIFVTKWPMETLQLAHAKADSEGRFRIPGLAPGVYRVIAVSLGTLADAFELGEVLPWVWDRAETVTLERAEVKDVALRLNGSSH